MLVFIADFYNALLITGLHYFGLVVVVFIQRFLENCDAVYSLHLRCRFPVEIFPENIQCYMRFREACDNVEHRNTFLQTLQPNEQDAIKLSIEVEETMSDIKSSLEVKRAAAESAGVPFDLKKEDWEEYWSILEDLDARANVVISGVGRVTEVDAETFKSGIFFGIFSVCPPPPPPA